MIMSTSSPAHASLNVIGLISGGKDSFFSLLHCIKNGHHVIALANLYSQASQSAEGSLEDLNSFMFQTVGQGIIPLHAEALDLPLYRQQIKGSALDQSKDYRHVSNAKDLERLTAQEHGDETESLLPLLRTVMNAHPTANAICSGAILSSYQRTRIESVARRLNLIPLSYLWQYPSLPPPSPGGLLDDVAAAGFNIRIVKVASGGLDEDLLWANLTDIRVRKKLQRANDRFGGSILGEGGEYETLVVDGPMPFWKGRIETSSEERWIGRGGGGEAWIGFREASGRVILKRENKSENEDAYKEKVRTPEFWDEEFEKLVKKIASIPCPRPFEYKSYNLIDSRPAWGATTSVIQSPSYLTIHNMTAPQAGSTAREQMLSINSQLLEIYTENGPIEPENINFTTILLRTMMDFAIVNDVYGQLFSKPNPPARVTIACGNALPPKVEVMVSFFISLDNKGRKGLHVQSRSYWAPANIGPYSQAISVPLKPDDLDSRMVYVAGQIPLVPATMEVLVAEQNTDDGASEVHMALFQRRASLCLQHLWRIGRVMEVRLWTFAIAFIVGEGDIEAKAMMAWKIWEQLHQAELWETENQDHEEDVHDNFDIWDIKHGGAGTFVKHDLINRKLPDFENASTQAWGVVPPFFAVQVYGLPRGCDVEWQSEGIAYTNPCELTAHSPCSYFTIPSNDVSSEDDFKTKIKEVLDEQQRYGDVNITIYTPRPDLLGQICAQIIPCKSIWGSAGTNLAAGLIIQNRT